MEEETIKKDIRMSDEPLTDIEVQLTGINGNAYCLMAAVRSGLKENGRSDLIEPFLREATASDYQNLLRTCRRYCVIL